MIKPESLVPHISSWEHDREFYQEQQRTARRVGMNYHWQACFDATNDAIGQLMHLKLQLEDGLIYAEQFRQAIADYISYIDAEIKRLDEEAYRHDGMPYANYLESKSSRLKTIREVFYLLKFL